MKKLTIALLAIVPLAVFSTAALAERGGPPGLFGGGHGFPGPGLMLEHMADHLDLDEAQRNAVSNIFEAARPEIEALREKARANREALEALDVNDAAYSTELNNIAISNGELATEGTLLFTRIRSEVHAVLTDEQIAKLERGKERMKRRFEHRRQRG